MRKYQNEQMLDMIIIRSKRKTNIIWKVRPIKKTSPANVNRAIVLSLDFTPSTLTSPIFHYYYGILV